MAGSGEHPAVHRTPSGGCPPASSSQLRDNWLPRHVRADGESPREESNFIVPLMLPAQRRSGPAFAGVSRFSPLKGMGSSVSRYRMLFTRFEIQSQDALLRLPNRRLYLGPHVQEYLVGLDICLRGSSGSCGSKCLRFGRMEWSQVAPGRRLRPSGRPRGYKTLGTCCLELEATACAFHTYSQSSGLTSSARNVALILRPSGGESSTI